MYCAEGITTMRWASPQIAASRGDEAGALETGGSIQPAMS